MSVRPNAKQEEAAEEVRQSRTRNPSPDDSAPRRRRRSSSHKRRSSSLARRTPPPAPLTPLPTDAPSSLLFSDVPLRSAESVPFLPLVLMQQCLQSLNDYKPYIDVDSLNAPTHSFSYFQRQIRFFCHLANPQLWSTRPQQAFDRGTYTSLNLQLIQARLDLDRIRRDFPLGRDNEERLKDLPLGYPFWNALYDVLSWIYGRTVEGREACRFIEHVPTNLLVLIRLHVDLTRYAQVVNLAFLDFRHYLISQPFHLLSPKLQRARELVQWLTLFSVNTTKAPRYILWWSQEIMRGKGDDL